MAVPFRAVVLTRGQACYFCGNKLKRDEPAIDVPQTCCFDCYAKAKDGVETFMAQLAEKVQNAQKKRDDSANHHGLMRAYRDKIISMLIEAGIVAKSPQVGITKEIPYVKKSADDWSAYASIQNINGISFDFGVRKTLDISYYIHRITTSSNSLGRNTRTGTQLARGTIEAADPNGPEKIVALGMEYIGKYGS